MLLINPSIILHQFAIGPRVIEAPMQLGLHPTGCGNYPEKQDWTVLRDWWRVGTGRSVASGRCGNWPPSIWHRRSCPRRCGYSKSLQQIIPPPNKKTKKKRKKKLSITNETKSFAYNNKPPSIESLRRLELRYGLKMNSYNIPARHPPTMGPSQ